MKKAFVIGGIVLVTVVFFKIIAAIGVIGFIIVCGVLLSGGDSGGQPYQQPQQPQPQQGGYNPRTTVVQAPGAVARQDFYRDPYGRGANGVATAQTYPVGSSWQQGVRTHPTTGLQNGTDVHYHGNYAGTYSNDGVYTWDPDGRTILPDR